MGSEFEVYTIDRAAQVLGCTRRNIYYYIKKGILTKIVDDQGHSCVYKSEIHMLLEQEELPFLDRKAIVQMQSNIKKLQEDMTVMRRILDVRSEPLAPTPQEAEALYTMAVRSEKEQEWRLEEIIHWTNLYDRMDEGLFQLLSEKFPEPWKAFLKLAIAQMNFLASRKDFNTDLELQLVYTRLNQGRKRLRDGAIWWIQIYGDPTSKAYLEGLNTPSDPLLNRLSQRVEKLLSTLG